MSSKPVIVYLDNQDYSNMANIKRHANEPDLPQLLEELRKLKASGDVKFVFSAICVAEALPMSASDVELSLRQLRLLRDLCEDNALINYAKLISGEVANLCGEQSKPIQVLSGPFDWLPSGLESELAAPSEAKTIRQEAVEIVNASKAAKADSRTRSAALAWATQEVRRIRLENRQARIDRGEFFYVKSRFHDVMLRASVGEASITEKTEAFLESWNDLEWVVGLYHRLPDLADWYRDLVRQPNARAAGALRKLVSALEGQEMPRAWRSAGWRQLRDNHLVSLVGELCIRFKLPYENVTAARIQQQCPGMSVEAGVIWSLTWAYVAGGMKKEILSGSAADAMHAAYAPYVDVFRTDRSMAPHVVAALHAKHTQVVGDRRQLVSAITSLLQRRGAA